MRLKFPLEIISIHAPREGGDRAHAQRGTAQTRFQSTPPARGATPSWEAETATWEFQSTPPARGATWTTILTTKCQQISIHAPREGGDLLDPHLIHLRSYFNPRPPRGGRPAMRLLAKYLDTFQSTPPARGATPPVPPPLPAALDFNPRPPRGGRQHFKSPLISSFFHFNPRPPRGGRPLASQPHGA